MSHDHNDLGTSLRDKIEGSELSKCARWIFGAKHIKADLISELDLSKSRMRAA
jgi:hypothetical protein